MSRQAVSSSAGRIITGHSSHSLPAALKNAAVPAQVYCRATWFGGHEATLTQLLRHVHTRARCACHRFMKPEHFSLVERRQGRRVLTWLPWKIASFLTLAGPRREVLN